MSYIVVHLLSAVAAENAPQLAMSGTEFAIQNTMTTFGKIRSIGLSNWYVEELEDFLPQVNITPALVQNEIHLYYQENDVITYIQGLVL